MKEFGEENWMKTGFEGIKSRYGLNDIRFPIFPSIWLFFVKNEVT